MYNLLFTVFLVYWSKCLAELEITEAVFVMRLSLYPVFKRLFFKRAFATGFQGTLFMAFKGKRMQIQFCVVPITFRL